MRLIRKGRFSMKKKLLFITYTYSLGGGAEKILTNIVNSLNPEKYDIDILEYAQYGVKDETVNPYINKMAPIVSMQDDSKYKRLWKNIQVYSYAGFLRKRKEKYDLEISFNYLIPTFLLSKDTPTVAWFHGDISNLKRMPYCRMIQRHSLKYVNKIVAISENTKQSIVEVYPEYSHKLEVIYNGFDVGAIRKEGQAENEIDIKQPSIVYVGRLEEGKNPLILLDVVKKLKDDGKIVYLYYVGQGEKNKEILQKSDMYGLQEQVFLLGYQKNPYPIMRKCSAICMMSHSEGFPTVFAEGLALGTPFISTPVGGVKELSNGGRCGCIVNSVSECVDAIKKFVLDEEEHRRMQVACEEHIHIFDLQTQIAQIETLFDDMMCKNENR